ncbi:hypothetical protein GOQ04_06895 [Emticicia sp. ODNR4P]|nr:hypothetical protein [Emticicia sp. ODNR4P]
MKKFMVVCLFLHFTLESCYKALPEPKNATLPEITTVGANTFGCLANDLVWQNNGNRKGPYSSTIKNEVFSLFYLYQKKDNAVLRIYGQMTYTNTDQQLSIDIYNKDLLKTGTFPISSASFEDFLKSKKYDFIDTLNPPLVKIIKLDTISKIASGTFEGNIYTKNKLEKMTIKNGRFDVKLK